MLALVESTKVSHQILEPQGGNFEELSHTALLLSGRSQVPAIYHSMDAAEDQQPVYETKKIRYQSRESGVYCTLHLTQSMFLAYMRKLF